MAMKTSVAPHPPSPFDNEQKGSPIPLSTAPPTGRLLLPLGLGLPFPPPTTTFETVLQGAFAQVDTDGGGTLNMREFNQMCDDVLGWELTETALTRIFVEAGAGTDMEISADGFVRLFVSYTRAKPGASLRYAVQTLSTNFGFIAAIANCSAPAWSCLSNTIRGFVPSLRDGDFKYWMFLMATLCWNIGGLAYFYCMYCAAAEETGRWETAQFQLAKWAASLTPGSRCGEEAAGQAAGKTSADRRSTIDVITEKFLVEGLELTLKEMRMVLEQQSVFLSTASLLRLFREVDTNGGGGLSLQEVLDFMARENARPIRTPQQKSRDIVRDMAKSKLFWFMMAFEVANIACIVALVSWWGGLDWDICAAMLDVCYGFLVIGHIAFMSMIFQSKVGEVDALEDGVNSIRQLAVAAARSSSHDAHVLPGAEQQRLGAVKLFEQITGYYSSKTKPKTGLSRFKALAHKARLGIKTSTDISPKDFARFLEQNGVFLPETHVQRIFCLIDTSGDGALCKDELTSWCQNVRPLSKTKRFKRAVRQLLKDIGFWLQIIGVIAACLFSAAEHIKILQWECTPLPCRGHTANAIAGAMYMACGLYPIKCCLGAKQAYFNSVESAKAKLHAKFKALAQATMKMDM